MGLLPTILRELAILITTNNEWSFTKNILWEITRYKGFC